MATLKFVTKRLLYAAFGLFGLSVFIFVVSRILPGDPARIALGPRAPQWAVEKLREQLHLNDPIPKQYGIWLANALHGDFGESLYTRRPVMEDIKEFLPATAQLVLLAALIQASFGILLGIIAGRRRNTWIDNLTRVFAYLGVATPAFAIGILLLLLFGFLLNLLPTTGQLTAGVQRPPVITNMILFDSLIAGNFAAFFDNLKHMILPAISICLAGMAQLARITRVTVGENLRKEYIFASRGYGVPEWRIALKYLLKPSLIPPVSLLGMQIGALFSNAFLVELVFNWPGFSRYGVNVMLRKDLNAIAAVALLMGAIYITMNLLVDFGVGALDPRVRLGEKSA